MHNSNARYINILIFALGFIGAQRFLLESIQPYISIFPLLLFWVCFLTGKSRSMEATTLVAALYLLVDSGGGVYNETPSFLRYTTYISATIMLLIRSQVKVKLSSAIVIVAISCIIMITTVTLFFSDTPFDITSFKRDFIVAIILLFILVSGSIIKINLAFLFVLILGYLIGEVINLSFFYSNTVDYLNYTSIKSLIIFPVLYAFHKNLSITKKAALLSLTIAVISTYGTRMIPLSIILLSISAIIISANQFTVMRYIKLTVALFIFGYTLILSSQWIEYSELAKFKVISFLPEIIRNIGELDLIEVLKQLDPVRYFEHVLFFDRPAVQIIFGSGLGSGLNDVNGLLEFVSIYDTAFSQNELASSHFFNLHDMWIDYGLRFGVMLVAYIFWNLVFSKFKQKSYTNGILYGVLLINTTYTWTGILLLVLIYKSLGFNDLRLPDNESLTSSISGDRNKGLESALYNQI